MNADRHGCTHLFQPMDDLIFTMKILFFAALLLVTGCTTYRQSDYALRFTDARTGAPQTARQLEIVFAHEVFPLNAPHTIHTNLDENGAAALRLPDHFPTWMFLSATNSGTRYVFNLDLHALQRDARLSLSMSDKHTGECQLVLTKSGESK
jgi:hypothetical protein